MVKANLAEAATTLRMNGMPSGEVEEGKPRLAASVACDLGDVGTQHPCRLLAVVAGNSLASLTEPCIMMRNLS